MGLLRAVGVFDTIAPNRHARARLQPLSLKVSVDISLSGARSQGARVDKPPRGSKFWESSIGRAAASPARDFAAPCPFVNAGRKWGAEVGPVRKSHRVQGSRRLWFRDLLTPLDVAARRDRTQLACRRLVSDREGVGPQRSVPGARRQEEAARVCSGSGRYRLAEEECAEEGRKEKKPRGVVQ